MASFEATVITAGSADRFFSIWPFRASASFQVVLFEARLRAMEGLASMLLRVSMLFRRSSS
jgi:hypothetical protein